MQNTTKTASKKESEQTTPSSSTTEVRSVEPQYWKSFAISVSGLARIDLERPCIDSAGHVFDVGESLLAQEQRRLHAAAAVVTVRHNRGFAVGAEFIKPVENLKGTQFDLRANNRKAPASNARIIRSAPLHFTTTSPNIARVLIQ